jgi:hypothetical protein
VARLPGGEDPAARPGIALPGAASGPGRARSPGACRRRFAWALVLAVAAVHVLRAGSHLHGAPHRLYYGYASDILLPLAAYFMLCLGEARQTFLRGAWMKAAIVFAVAAAAETLQGFGVPALGRTFDPLDFAMYAVGTGLALMLDGIVVRAHCGTAVPARSPRRLNGPEPYR